MTKLRVCYSMFIDETEGEKLAAELMPQALEYGAEIIRSNDARFYGIVRQGVLYVSRLFPVSGQNQQVTS